MPSSGGLPSRPTTSAPADLTPGGAERLHDWIAGACLSARDLEAALPAGSRSGLAGEAGGEAGPALAIGAAMARLRAVTVSRRSDGLDQELLADELLDLCLRYPADIALSALEQAKAASRFFPTYADLLTALETPLKLRRNWLRAVAGWPAQLADGRQREALQIRRRRAARILARLEGRRPFGGWLPCDQAEWDRQSGALARLEAKLAALERSARPAG